ncbi:hypothetical protein ACKUFS_25860 [Pseudomonas cannabina]|uniref:hypothetical protein n=1 Tax=Pseudomonas syringae group TaxID=136849 RepID=UPI0006B963ED|nr:MULTISPECIES: hypothetical protein [Pseudomonas syringae group]QQN22688.1 hypothetical protein JGS08_02890 [Pseudomonas cannabina pv. alisalensis]UBY99957.1 hypothetical protein LCG56_13085 [Pseudomonas cannabina pv. alisalensis]
MTDQKSRRVLIDTGVLLAHPDIISRIRDKHNLPVLLAEAITVLNDQRAQPTEQGKNAERVLEQIEGGRAQEVKQFPAGAPLQQGDLLAEFKFDGAPAFIFKRQRFSAQTAGTRLVEVACQYGDCQKFCVRA